ncbi:ubiquinone anaerobic biosynthesis protein UbiV [Hoeflea prorocentri]|uniref:Ubiquinone biosynthesis protein UbiV n=1 Tax=Hoeflea prorocentri TaxID=1922333 RepID=A0A9X3UHW8_9HYPH|nr:U32 family peptidase [Hoeflea prorocentri]MCY6381130.1 U32 family peptidase [Hoeflea prorocentri]MDA5398930.1 U32 family peptidase [Hoeflea prorocentri]
MQGELTLGPVLFNWQPEVWRDFYFEIADEAPVSRVYVGEVVCSKRAPLFDKYVDAVVDRLKTGGKQVYFSSLAEVSSAIDRRLVKAVTTDNDAAIEVNDISALWHLSGKPHVIGPFVNVYNEDSLDALADEGATHICLSPELPKEGIAALTARAQERGVTLETQVFGRIPLALSARCYHARAHGRTKDSCKFICDLDPDGMELNTLDGQPFLTVNGIQTMSYTRLNLVCELAELMELGISHFRLSPHSAGTMHAAKVFRAVLDDEITAEEANGLLQDCGPDVPFSNGFFHHKPGVEWRVSGALV